MRGMQPQLEHQRPQRVTARLGPLHQHAFRLECLQQAMGGGTLQAQLSGDIDKAHAFGRPSRNQFEDQDGAAYRLSARQTGSFDHLNANLFHLPELYQMLLTLIITEHSINSSTHRNAPKIKFQYMRHDERGSPVSRTAASQ